MTRPYLTDLPNSTDLPKQALARIEDRTRAIYTPSASENVAINPLAIPLLGSCRAALGGL